ncbi:M14 family metallopeptidase [Roseovarius aestuarii]|nr:M14 family metallopeptidase [Roseovarius aestuarii]
MHSTETIALPTTSPGTNRHLTVHRWGAPGTRPKVYIQAGLHADEFPGVLAACHLIPLLDAAQRAGQILGEVVLLPAVNPIGLSQSLHMQHLGRFAFGDGGENFNRGWPDLSNAVLMDLADALGSDPVENTSLLRAALSKAVAALPDLSERQAHIKALLSLSIDADFVFDLHCDAQALLHLYAHEEHRDLAAQLGQVMGAHAVLLGKGVDTGLFDECNAGVWIKVRRALGLTSETLPAACFAPIVELRGQRDVSHDAGAQDAANLFAFLQRHGVISGPSPTPPRALCDATSVDGCELLRAPVSGVVIWHVPLGALVAPGDHLADILNVTDEDPLTSGMKVLASQAGVLFSQRMSHLTRPGEILGQIAGKAPHSLKTGGEFY